MQKPFRQSDASEHQSKNRDNKRKGSQSRHNQPPHKYQNQDHPCTFMGTAQYKDMYSPASQRRAPFWTTTSSQRKVFGKKLDFKPFELSHSKELQEKVRRHKRTAFNNHHTHSKINDKQRWVQRH